MRFVDRAEKQSYAFLLAGLLGLLAWTGCGDPDTTTGDDAGTEGIVGQPPSPPKELAVVGIKPTVSLSWQAAVDDVGVVGYKVFRDDVEIADLAETSFVDTFKDGEPPKTCKGNEYSVKAYDGDGNNSEPSEKVRSTIPVKNVVFMIGDGMGPEHQRAAGCYLFGPDQGSPGNQLSFETLPVKGEVTTAPANGQITDSAAAGTAMATGQKVNNGAVSIAVPGDGSDLYTILECFKDQGRITGLVTTTTISHATPAAFGAHVASRYELGGIVSDYLDQSKPNILFGGVESTGITPSLASAAGYTVVTDRTELQALPADTVYVSGQFGTGHMPYEYDAAQAATNPYDTLPHLRDMTQAALDLLGSYPEGFFLMVEGGRIDHAGHDNNIEQNIFETIEFDKAAKIMIDWASSRQDTLLIVTADHETGGLTVNDCGAKGEFPSVSWSSVGHTAANVEVHADGPRASRLSGTIDNTAFFDAITDGSPAQ